MRVASSRVTSLLFIVATPAVVVILVWTTGAVPLVTTVTVAAWIVVLVRVCATETSDHPGARGARVHAAALWIACLVWLLAQSVATGFPPSSWWEYWQQAATGSRGDQITGALAALSLASGAYASVLSLWWARRGPEQASDSLSVGDASS